MKLKFNLLRHIIIRLIVYILTGIIAFSVIFFCIRLVPGNPVRNYLNSMLELYGVSSASAKEIIKHYEKKFGLDKDLFTQYICFWKNLLLHGDLGPSMISFPDSSQKLIMNRLPWTIFLLSFSTIISWVIGVFTGVLAGWKKGSKVDHILYSISICTSRIPYYILAVVLVLTLCYTLNLFPSGGAYSPNIEKAFTLEFILDVIYHAFLPALSIVIISSFGWLLTTRALVISILGEDYLLFAEAKGLKESRILKRYVLRNVLAPQVSGLGMSLGGIVGGSFLVEWIFRYHGIGMLYIEAINILDYNVIQGVSLITIFCVLLANFLVDITHSLIDPRVRVGG